MCPVRMQVDPPRLVAMPFRLGMTSLSLSSVVFLGVISVCWLWISKKKHCSKSCPPQFGSVSRATQAKSRATLQLPFCSLLLSIPPSALVIYWLHAPLHAQLPSWPSVRAPFLYERQCPGKQRGAHYVSSSLHLSNVRIVRKMKVDLSITLKCPILKKKYKKKEDGTTCVPLCLLCTVKYLYFLLR